MNKPITISEKERIVLEVLAEEFSGEANCFYFRGIVSRLKGLKNELDERQVRIACRSLARKGLAEFQRGLFDQDGMVAGSGYSATEQGAALISPCDDCGNLAHYDWEEDAQGNKGWEADFDESTSRNIRKCEVHYVK